MSSTITKALMLVITIHLASGKDCNCPSGYTKRPLSNECRINVERIPCNAKVPTCVCPKRYVVTPSGGFGYVCSYKSDKIHCENKKEFDDFLDKIIDNSNWKGPVESCKCADDFKVAQYANAILCINPHSYWREVPCGIDAPPTCKCLSGEVYGISLDNKKAAYNSLLGCRANGGEVTSCANEGEIRRYFDLVLRILEGGSP